MKRIIIADLHFSVYSSGTIIEGIPEKLYYLKQTLINICDYAMEKEIRIIDVLGDIYHNKFLIYTIAQTSLLEIIRSYPDITFNCIQGNHDISTKADNPASCIFGLKNEPNVNVYIEPYLDEENDILIVPYFKNMGDYIKSNTATTLYSHFGLNEALVNSGTSIRTDIKLSDLKGKYKNVFLGHYHLPQEIIEDDINFYYTGSIIQLTNNEKNEEKRFLIFDTKTNEVQSILTKGYKKLYEFIINEDNKTEVLKKIKILREEEEESEINIVIKDKIEEESSIENDISSIENVNFIDKREMDIAQRSDLTSFSSDDEIIDSYMEYKKIPEDKIKKYKNVALKYF